MATWCAKTALRLFYFIFKFYFYFLIISINTARRSKEVPMSFKPVSYKLGSKIVKYAFN